MNETVPHACYKKIIWKSCKKNPPSGANEESSLAWTQKKKINYNNNAYVTVRTEIENEPFTDKTNYKQNKNISPLIFIYPGQMKTIQMTFILYWMKKNK